MEKNDVRYLKTAKYVYAVPPEFSNSSEKQLKTLPFYYGDNRIRFRYDIMSPSDGKEECEVLKRFYTTASKLISE